MSAPVNCPKCGHPQADDNAICPACGIVFEKYYKYHARPGEADQLPQVEVIVADEPASLGRRLLALATHQEPVENPLLIGGRALVWAGLVYWSFSLIGSSIASNAVGESFLHLVNLPFHEAGHVIFRLFGNFIGSLGGTLGQLLMPLIAGATLLLKTRDPFGAAVCLWWFGENFLDIAPYINDARAGQLPLLGGNFGHSAPYGFHDWEYLLTETGLIHWDHGLARASFALGSLLMLLALAWAGWLLLRQWRLSK